VTGVPDKPLRQTPAFIVLTCEHAGNEVPPAYEHLFKGQTAVLQTHRGHDPGALDVALRLASQLAAPIQFTQVSRLLVDTNRSEGSEQLFSEFSRSLSVDERNKLLDDYYRPHRSGVEKMISAIIDTGRFVLHVAVHSFVDRLDGQLRDSDIGLLFDPERRSEAAIAARCLEALSFERADLRCVCNQPYLGTDDGLTTMLRQAFDMDKYAGLEMEIRQGILGLPRAREELAAIIAYCLKQARLCQY